MFYFTRVEYFLTSFDANDTFPLPSGAPDIAQFEISGERSVTQATNVAKVIITDDFIQRVTFPWWIFSRFSTETKYE